MSNTPSEEQEREVFEKWWISTDPTYPLNDLIRNDSGQYERPNVERYWQGWKARASQESARIQGLEEALKEALGHWRREYVRVDAAQGMSHAQARAAFEDDGDVIRLVTALSKGDPKNEQ